MTLSRFNPWTAVTAAALASLMAFCLAGAAIACGVKPGALAPQPAVARVVSGAGAASALVLARL